MWQATQHVVANKSLSARACSALNEFQNLINEMSLEVEQKELQDLMSYAVHHSGLYEFHKAEKGEKGLTRIENLSELENAGRHFETVEDELPLMTFLDSAALDAGEAQADEFDDAVQLMTLHSAKGLEFPLVFLAGAEENLFPHKRSLEDSSQLQEERRLCYVGITRAMQELVITYAESRRIYGSESYNSVSRFIKEIPPELLNEVRIKNTVTRPVSFERKKPLRLSDDGENTGFYLGQRVTHPMFGEGKVLHFEGDGTSARVQVNFDSEGKKWLVLKFAKLEACNK
jgi:DNA helicase-2/ATP-dependent DNA helicase PcrA